MAPSLEKITHFGTSFYQNFLPQTEIVYRIPEKKQELITSSLNVITHAVAAAGIPCDVESNLSDRFKPQTLPAKL